MKKLLVAFSALLILSSCNGLEANLKPAYNGVKASPPAIGGTVKFEMYPNPDKIPVIPGKEILFKFTPLVNDPNIKQVSINFGDGTPAKSYELQRNITLKSGSDPIFIPHTFKRDGYYLITVKGVREGSSKKNFLANTKITIVPKIVSEEELKDKAIREMTAKLCTGLDQFVKKNKKSTPLAFSSLKDANFEYAKDQLDVQVIQKMTQYLVEKGYKILEKSPSALVRLAHESVIKVNPKNWKATDYQKHLEYGLATQFVNSSMPFLYGAKIEGIDDLVTSTKNNENAASEADMSSAVAGLFGKKKSHTDEAITKKLFSTREYKNRPLLLAKFNTARYLVVIDRIIDPVVESSGPYYYSLKYDKTMIERVAKVKINARILDRNGTIRWMKEIDGSATDKIVEEFANAQKIKTKKGFF